MSKLNLLEFNVIKTCNMNCKGCDHFSTLFNSPEIISVETFKKDLSRIRDLGVETIKTICLLGGEPLLVPNLYEYVKICGEIYPQSKVTIRTNGILLLKMPEPLRNVLKEHNAKIIISLYPNMKDKKGKMHRFLKKCGIDHDFLVFKEQFCKLLSVESNQEDLRKYCIASSPTLENGLLYVCPLSAYIHKLNNRFGYTFPENEGIDIYSEKFSAEDICEFVKNPIRLCEYCCRKEMSVFKWECNYRMKVQGTDWVMQNDDEKMEDFKNKREIAYTHAIQKDKRWMRYKALLFRMISRFKM